MKLLTLARSFFHRKHRGNLSLRADKVQNEYADYHQYSSVDYGDYSCVESTSTYGALPCKNATLAPDSIKHLVLIHRSDGRLKFKASCENGEISDMINVGDHRLLYS
ncbi:unnamed protein product [Cylicostephanus goldi]|uniref:Uncharacterized protein n=1 Tax=Cylicostephanus goldi TaxID=71465 RepID=A0A3P6SM29_CYLGO|nr:unnamed protein product [Cylicostephanus goldi]